MLVDQFIAVFYPLKRRGWCDKFMTVTGSIVIMSSFAFEAIKLFWRIAWLEWLSLQMGRVVITFGTLTLVVLYLATAFRLRKQSKKVRPSKSSTMTVRWQKARNVSIDIGPAKETVSDAGSKSVIRVDEKQAQTSLDISAPPPANNHGTKPSKTDMTVQAESKKNERIRTNTQPTEIHIKVLKIYTAISLIFILSFSFLFLVLITGQTLAAYGYFINHISNPVIYYMFVDKFREQVRKYWRKLRERCCGD